MGEEPFAEVYEKLKGLRRRGELAEGAAEVTDAIRLLNDARIAEEKIPGYLIRSIEIRSLANRVFGDEKKAETWLDRANPSFSGQKPIDLLKDELGAAVVREALEQIDHGIFA
jgi:putative toxin-antitoxin system antitoxin component (TIGR02293 family)